jgi:hypothetical protein
MELHQHYITLAIPFTSIFHSIDVEAWKESDSGKWSRWVFTGAVGAIIKVYKM